MSIRQRMLPLLEAFRDLKPVEPSIRKSFDRGFEGKGRDIFNSPEETQAHLMGQRASALQMARQARDLNARKDVVKAHVDQAREVHDKLVGKSKPSEIGAKVRQVAQRLQLTGPEPKQLTAGRSLPPRDRPAMQSTETHRWTMGKTTNPPWGGDADYPDPDVPQIPWVTAAWLQPTIRIRPRGVARRFAGQPEHSFGSLHRKSIEPADLSRMVRTMPGLHAQKRFSDPSKEDIVSVTSGGRISRHTHSRFHSFPAKTKLADAAKQRTQLAHTRGGLTLAEPSAQGGMSIADAPGGMSLIKPKRK